MGTRRRRVSVIRSRSKPVKWDDLRMDFISKCTADTISNAAQALKDGRLVAFPTETVYGLGADATNEKAVSRIYSVKGRPSDHPLIVHISSINQLDKWASDIPDYAIKLAREFWPGPMTLILPRTDLAKDFITGGQNNVGLRVPAQPIALALLKNYEKLGGFGVAAPSANRFGAVSPTTPDAVIDELGMYLNESDLVLDGGQCFVGIESTIVDCTSSVPSVLRPGAIYIEQIEQATNIFPIKISSGSSVKTSGTMKAHYAPKARIQLNILARENEGLIALANVPTPMGVVRIGSPSSLEELARDLYLFFRMGDKKDLETVSVLLPPETHPLLPALRDRIEKASNSSQS